MSPWSSASPQLRSTNLTSPSAGSSPWDNKTEKAGQEYLSGFCGNNVRLRNCIKGQRREILRQQIVIFSLPFSINGVTYYRPKKKEVVYMELPDHLVGRSVTQICRAADMLCIGIGAVVESTYYRDLNEFDILCRCAWRLRRKSGGLIVADADLFTLMQRRKTGRRPCLTKRSDISSKKSLFWR